MSGNASFLGLKRKTYLIPAILIFLLYLPIVRYEYLQNDLFLLRNLSSLVDPNRWLFSLTAPFGFSINHYRPLAQLLLVIQLTTGGQGAWIFHLFQVLLHSANTLMVAWLALQLTSTSEDGAQATWLPILAGATYGLHPALVAGVVQISAQFDLFMTTFLLLALVLDLHLQGHKARPWLFSLMYCLALLCHEFALSFLIIYPLWILAMRRAEGKPTASFWQRIRGCGKTFNLVGLISISALYVGLRYLVLRYLFLIPAVNAGNILQRVLLAARSFLEYLLLAIFPFGRVKPIHYLSLPMGEADLAAWMSLAIMFLCVVGLFLLVRERPRSGWLAAAAAIGILLLSNLIPLPQPEGGLIAERQMLFPFALLLLASVPLLESAAAWIEGTIPQIGPSAYLPVVWITGFILSFQILLPQWNNNLTLWRWAASREPEAPPAYVNLAREYLNQTRYESVLTAAAAALEIEPSNGEALNLAGLAYLSLEEYNEAVQILAQATELYPQNALYWNNLAASYREQGDMEKAESILVEKSLKLNPNLDIAYLNLATVYLRIERPDLALQVVDEFERRFPGAAGTDLESLLQEITDTGLWLDLAIVLLEEDPSAAVEVLDKALELGAEKVEVALLKSSAYIIQEDWSEAENVLQEANLETPNDARILNNLGIVAKEQGDFQAAEAYFTQAIAIAPDWQLPQDNLDMLFSPDDLISAGN